MEYTLHDYLIRHDIHIDGDLATYIDMDHFLNTTIVILSFSETEKAPNLPYMDSYLEFVDSIVRHMLTNKVANCLIDGYVNNSLHAGWTSSNYNPHTSFKVNSLKSPQWHHLYDLIGKTCFVKLIFGSKIYIKAKNGGYFQLCGKEIIGQFKDRSYKEFVPNKDILPLEYQTMLREVIGTSTSKKYHGLSQLCFQIHQKHLKCNYVAIYTNIVSKPPSVDETLTVHPLLLNQVIQYVVVISRKLLNKEIWGSLKNQKLFTALLTDYIVKGERVLKQIPPFSIKVIPWLGNNTIVHNKDLVTRKLVLVDFLQWFLGIFIRRLCCRFWKCVKVNSKGIDTFNYYPIHTWISASRHWLDAYADTYLYEVHQEFTKTINLNNHFIGSVKLVPKKSGFRMISKPLRSRPLALINSKDEDIRYSHRIKRFVRPLLFLLNTKDRDSVKQRPHQLFVYSSQDVVRYLNEFRLSLTKEQINHLHFVKFDMKHCYDNINHDKLLQAVDHLFVNDNDEQCYFIRQVKETFMFSKQGDKLKFILKDTDTVAEFDPELYSMTSGANKAISDKGNTTKFTKTLVIDSINDYIKNSGVFLNNNTLYKRKVGLFQGFPLLSTLCNVFYNNLVNDKLSFTLENDNPSILLRLMDDFLFISCDKDLCKKVYNTVNTEFPRFGVYLNEDKTEWVTGTKNLQQSLTFVGLEINTTDLTLSSTVYNPKSLALEKCTNYKQFYLFMIWWYKLQLKDYIIALTYNSFVKQFANLETVWKVLVKTINLISKVLSGKGMIVSVESHAEFLLSLCDITLSKWEFYNGKQWNSDILEVFKHYLRQQEGNKYICRALKVLDSI